MGPRSEPQDVGFDNPILWLGKRRLHQVERLAHSAPLGQGRDSEARVKALGLCGGPEDGSGGARTAQRDGAVFALHPCAESQLPLWTFQNPEELCETMPPFVLCVRVCVCVCVFSLIDFPLFNLEFSRALVFRGSLATQAGQRNVGSLFCINTVSHMYPQLPRTSRQDPSLPSFGRHTFPEDWGQCVLCPQSFSCSSGVLGTWLSTHPVLSFQPPEPRG